MTRTNFDKLFNTQPAINAINNNLPTSLSQSNVTSRPRDTTQQNITNFFKAKLTTKPVMITIGRLASDQPMTNPTDLTSIQYQTNDKHLTAGDTQHAEFLDETEPTTKPELLTNSKKPWHQAASSSISPDKNGEKRKEYEDLPAPKSRKIDHGEQHEKKIIDDVPQTDYDTKNAKKVMDDMPQTDYDTKNAKQVMDNMPQTDYDTKNAKQVMDDMPQTDKDEKNAKEVMDDTAAGFSHSVAADTDTEAEIEKAAASQSRENVSGTDTAIETGGTRAGEPTPEIAFEHDDSAESRPQDDPTAQSPTVCRPRRLRTKTSKANTVYDEQKGGKNVKDQVAILEIGKGQHKEEETGNKRKDEEVEEEIGEDTKDENPTIFTTNIEEDIGKETMNETLPISTAQNEEVTGKQDNDEELPQNVLPYESRILRCTRTRTMGITCMQTCLQKKETAGMQLWTKEGYRNVWCTACRKQNRCQDWLCDHDIAWITCAIHRIDPPEHRTNKVAQKIPRSAESQSLLDSNRPEPERKKPRKAVNKFNNVIKRKAVVQSAHPSIYQVDLSKCPKLQEKARTWREQLKNAQCIEAVSTSSTDEDTELPNTANDPSLSGMVRVDEEDQAASCANARPPPVVVQPRRGYRYPTRGAVLNSGDHRSFLPTNVVFVRKAGESDKGHCREDDQRSNL